LRQGAATGVVSEVKAISKAGICFTQTSEFRGLKKIVNGYEVKSYLRFWLIQTKEGISGILRGLIRVSGVNARI
jgi:hypothetical protein